MIDSEWAKKGLKEVDKKKKKKMQSTTLEKSSDWLAPQNILKSPRINFFYEAHTESPSSCVLGFFAIQ